jgi:hypothetical protein
MTSNDKVNEEMFQWVLDIVLFKCRDNFLKIDDLY